MVATVKLAGPVGSDKVELASASVARTQLTAGTSCGSTYFYLYLYSN